MSITAAFGARPWETVDGETAPNRGLQVAAFVHGLISGDEEGDQEQAEEDTTEDEQTEESEEEAESEEAGNHGQCVSEWARGDEVGGPNQNHGFVVSHAARVLCWEDSQAAEDTDDTQSDEATESESELQEAGPGNSAAAHARNAERKAAHAEAKAAKVKGGRGHAFGRAGRP
ncbi:MAG TPA: hypothetical protein VFH63_01240 [candidate division Zixibacteria bacterium]|nr:hypothetical protein [candidate division Zixibacteria bacterium]